jgi:hypothetical protein
MTKNSFVDFACNKSPVEFRVQPNRNCIYDLICNALKRNQAHDLRKLGERVVVPRTLAISGRRRDLTDYCEDFSGYLYP